MRILGVELTGKEARFALVEHDGESIAPLAIKPAKMTLDSDDTGHITDFAKAFCAVVSGNNINEVAIKSRNKVGEFAAGATTFKIEGIIQATCPVNVCLISPVSIASKFRKLGIDHPALLNKYQHSAFETACSR